MLSGDVESVHSMVMSCGQVIVGAWLSSTVMSCSQVLLLPQASVALQILEIEPPRGQAPAVVTSLYVIVGEASQLSVAVAIPVLSGEVESVHSMVIDTGQVMTGGVVSCTKMDALQVDEFPQSSVAVQVLVTVSSAGQVPGVVTSAKVMSTTASQASVAVAKPKVGVNGQSIVSFGITGQVMTGGVVS